MHLNELKDHLDRRLDQIEGKLDNHLERISKAEEAIVWIKGHVRLVMTLVITMMGGLVTAIYQLVTGKG